MLSIRIEKAQIKKVQIKKALLLGSLVGSIGAAISLVSGVVLPKASYANTLRLAQAASLEPQTLSVPGKGSASALATNAAVVFTFVSNSYPEYSDTGELLSPPELAQPSDLQDVVDAITAQGIASSVDVSRESYDYNYLQMVVKLNNPTIDRIDQIKEVAAEAAFADEEKRYSPSPAGVIYATDACDRLESEARKDAIADAEAQAAELAEASGLELGSLLAIAGGTNFSYYGPYETSCVSDVDEVLGSGPPYGFADQLSKSAEVTVDFGVYATYRVEE